MAKAKTDNKVEQMPSGIKFKSVKKVTGVPFYVMEEGKPAFIKFETALTAGMMKKKPALFANIINLETGELMKLCVHKVLSRQILEAYPDDSFVGKSFRIERGEKVEGNENSYYPYEIEEIEVE